MHRYLEYCVETFSAAHRIDNRSRRHHLDTVRNCICCCCCRRRFPSYLPALRPGATPRQLPTLGILGCKNEHRRRRRMLRPRRSATPCLRVGARRHVRGQDLRYRLSRRRACEVDCWPRPEPVARGRPARPHPPAGSRPGACRQRACLPPAPDRTAPRCAAVLVLLPRAEPLRRDHRDHGPVLEDTGRRGAGSQPKRAGAASGRAGEHRPGANCHRARAPGASPPPADRAGRYDAAKCADSTATPPAIPTDDAGKRQRLYYRAERHP
ncbi:hypothetical protein GQ53DRAFT_328886 [Thozetella sp. PMI_491]|nr:hypothetical protein GQ53DRAFT_328886 [Thozetella sp. PMI_491]